MTYSLSAIGLFFLIPVYTKKPRRHHPRGSNNRIVKSIHFNPLSSGQKTRLP